MYTLYKFHFLNGISEINQLFDDILIIWPAPVYIYIVLLLLIMIHEFVCSYNLSISGKQIWLDVCNGGLRETILLELR